jgi:hypothetical protein
MASTVTVTGTAGPGLTVSAVTFTGVTSFSIDTDSEMLTVVTNSVTKQVSIAAAATILVTVSGSNYTVTIAN